MHGIVCLLLLSSFVLASDLFFQQEISMIYKEKIKVWNKM